MFLVVVLPRARIVGPRGRDAHLARWVRLRSRITEDVDGRSQ